MNVCLETEFLKLLAQPDMGGVLSKKPHHIVVITYNDVNDFEEGEVASGKPGVRITVISGILYKNADFRFGMMLGTAAVYANDEEMGRISLELCHGTANELQEDVEGRGMTVLTQAEQTDLTVFLYAGLSARSGALKTLERLKQEFPHARCHVVTCDCNSPTDFGDFTEIIDTLIVCNWCGGRDFLGKIVRAVQNA